MSDREFNLCTAIAVALAIFFGVVCAYVLPAVIQPVNFTDLPTTTTNTGHPSGAYATEVAP